MRNWSAEEQTMIDLMELSGYGVSTYTNMDYFIVQLFKPYHAPMPFRADTEHEALRKAFKIWSTHNGKD
jgi:hypothetical protein